MRRCWDHNLENRPTAKETHYHLWRYYCSLKEVIKSAEAKRQEIIKSDEFLSDRNYKHHPGSFYTSRLLNESIQQAELLLSLSSTEIGSKTYYIDTNG